MPRTLLKRIWDAKIWHAHVVTQEPGAPAVLYLDAVVSTPDAASKE